MSKPGKPVVAAFIAFFIALARSPAPAADAPGADPATVHAQLLSVCEALKPRGGSCGARAREKAAADANAMSSAAPAGDAPGAGAAAPAKPVDVWGNPLRISLDNGSLRLQSPGADGMLDSGDDVVERCPIN